MALISHKKKWVFIHIPRTSGVSWWRDHEQDVDVHTKQHATAQEVLSEFGNSLLNYRWNTIIRNPYDRAVSLYLLFSSEGPRKGIDFDCFLQNHIHWMKPMVRYISTPVPVRWTIKRFEAIDFSKYGHWENKSGMGPYRDYYNDSQRLIVKKYFDADFKWFGYRWRSK